MRDRKARGEDECGCAGAKWEPTDSPHCAGFSFTGGCARVPGDKVVGARVEPRGERRAMIRAVLDSLVVKRWEERWGYWFSPAASGRGYSCPGASAGGATNPKTRVMRFTAAEEVG
jgi:hypothetical protein